MLSKEQKIEVIDCVIKKFETFQEEYICNELVQKAYELKYVKLRLGDVYTKKAMELFPELTQLQPPRRSKDINTWWSHPIKCPGVRIEALKKLKQIIESL
jgi:hypothetical protein